MPAITSANLAHAIVKLVAADALPALVGNLVMGNLVNRDFEPTLAQAGDTVNIPVPPSMTANNLIEGGSVVAQNPDMGNAQIVLNTHAEATFQIPDVTKVLAVPDLLRIYMQPAMVAIAERIESDLLSLYAGFYSEPGCRDRRRADHRSGGGRGGDGSLPGQGTDGRAQVPGGGRRHLLATAADHAGSVNTIRRAMPGLRALIDGTVGRIKDFFVFRSQFVGKTGTAPTTTHNLAFAKNAIGLVMRRLPQPLAGTGAVAHYAELGNFGMRVTMSYQPNTLAQQFTVDVLYGCAVIRNSVRRAGEHVGDRQPVDSAGDRFVCPQSFSMPGIGPPVAAAK